MTTRSAPLGVLLCIAACGRTEPLLRDSVIGDDAGQPDAGARDAGAGDAGTVDAGAVDAGSPLCPTGIALGSAVCTRTLLVGTVVPSMPSCFVDTVARTNERGVLEFDCQGGGAQARFSTGTFVGTFSNGQFTLCTGTTFDWSDRCRWGTAQRLQGPRSGPLAFTYEERPLEGRGCSSPCGARATVQIQ